MDLRRHARVGNRPHIDAAYDSPIGRLGITLRGAALTHIVLIGANDSVALYRSRPAQQVLKQLDRYFSDPRSRFELQLDPSGTPFQRRVWQALSMLLSGEVVTYGHLARQLGTSARAVGGACRANPIPLVIPCHRVTGANCVGGYMGTCRHVRLKRWLLTHECTV